MKPRSPALTLTLAFLSFHVASSLPPSPSPFPSPSPSPSRPLPKHTMSDPTGLHLRPPPPEGSVRHSCPSDPIECAKPHRHPPPRKSSSAGPTREFGRKMGLVFAGVALLMQVVFAGFLVYKRIQLREGFSGLPSTTAS